MRLFGIFLILISAQSFAGRKMMHFPFTVKSYSGANNDQKFSVVNNFAVQVVNISNVEQKIKIKFVPDQLVVNICHLAGPIEAQWNHTSGCWYNITYNGLEGDKKFSPSPTQYKIMITKTQIASFGMNFQNCHYQIFASLDFSFEGLYQAIRRSYRFGQKKEVNIYIITTDTMQNVLKSINAKQKQFDRMMEGITKEVNKNVYSIKTDYEKVEVKNDNYWIMNGDSCDLIKEIEDNSIDLSVFSPPFSTLFTYSDSIRDMGNCINDDEFFEQQHYLLTDLYKKMKNGRLVCVHTKDLARYKNSSGYSGMYDFTGEYHRAMERVGFKYHSKVTIWVDPVLEMQRTKTQRLLYKQLTSDSSYTGIGMPEYVTIFRKWEGDEKDWQPVTNKTKQNFDLNTWQKWASPIWGDKLTERELREVADLHSDILLKGVDAIDLREIKSKYAQSSWFDIQRTNVLNNYRDGRTVNDEKHICPLQLDIIERCIVLWSNVGDTVFTPFLGIGSELFQSIKLGRKGVGIELKPEYFNLAKKNLESISLEKLQKQLF
jgi:DNA modification methylase